MIFVGDIAMPDKGVIDYSDVQQKLGEKLLFGNLEGTLINDGRQLINQKIIFNDLDAIAKLLEDFNFAGFALANNHLFDVANYDITRKNLKKLNIDFTGAGFNENEAKKTLQIVDLDGTKINILNFGWEAIGCKKSVKKAEGVNEYYKDKVINQTKSLIESRKNEKIVIYFHWNYELELFPQPLDRKLSHILIDLGVDAVIGCHAHRVQGAEIYNGKPIVYGLGNWLFPQNKFWNQQLKFPEESLLQLGLEINFASNMVFCHWFEYDPIKQKIISVQTEPLDKSKQIDSFTPFKGFSHEYYNKWISTNRIKKKLLPIFYYNDSKIVYLIKIKWLKIRHQLIMLIKG